MQSIHVTLVVDVNFGAKAAELAARGPLWVVRSPENQRSVDQLRATTSLPPEYLTLFKGGGGTQEDDVLSELSVIDMHHDGWRTLEVIGTPPSASIQEALDGYGNGITQETADGFVFSRNPPES